MEETRKKEIKRVIAINDMSCFGKCSLTVALPVISAFGVEAVPLPTAVLSTHTGGFTGYTCLDMTDEMVKIIEHWKTIGFRCDGIYTGYFLNSRQADITAGFIDDFKNPGTKVIVDPVMGDNGKLYAGFDAGFVEDIKKLCKKAHVITPNVTEAMLLTGGEYREVFSREEIDRCADLLGGTGAKKAVITGVRINKSEIGYVCCDFESGDRFDIYYPYENMRLHGCGDVFASILCGELVKGAAFEESARAAADFTEDCIIATGRDIENHWYGLKFERLLENGSFRRGE